MFRSGAILLAALALPAGADPVPGHAGHALGRVEFPVSCEAAVGDAFEQAVALLHHMTYPQARSAFERIAAEDPGCAMAHWGIAMTLFQPLWPTRPSPAALARGWDEAQKAAALAPATGRERLFVASAEAFFREPGATDYWARIRRWAEATATLHEAFPDDPEAGAFHALALLAGTPADAVTHEAADRAAQILLGIHARNPDHPGAMHYLVHANDTPGREHEQMEIVRRYEELAPDNPHALHMPTHIYTRLGDWEGVIRGNLRAAEAALRYPAGEHGEYVWDEFPHAIEYLVYAYLQQGDDTDSATQIERLRATAQLEPSFKTAFHLASTQARQALERRDWEAAVSIEPRTPAALDWDRYPWAEATARFARGLGAVRLGRLEEARTQLDKLDTLEAAMAQAGEKLFERNIRVQRLELEAWLAEAQEKDDAGIATLREAAQLEASTPKHPVTPGPTLPAFEQLGELLLAHDEPVEALAAYTRSLELNPRRFNGLLGAARAARAAGQDDTARTHYRALLEVARAGTRTQALDEARAFVGAQP